MSAAINRQFLDATDTKTRNAVLKAIGEHYGVTPDEALAEVTGEGAEHLLDYLTEPVRSATGVLMQRVKTRP